MKVIIAIVALSLLLPLAALLRRAPLVGENVQPIDGIAVELIKAADLYPRIPPRPAPE